MMQGTDEWFSARLGKVTASRIVDVMAKGQGGKPSATRATYMGELVAERLTGVPTQSFTSGPMQHGTETETQARAVFELTYGLEVREVGFIHHPTIAMSGSSPDGITEAGGLEIKCPNTATHIAMLLGGNIKREYMMQMQWGMACTGEKSWDFISFDPRLPDDMQIYRRTIPMDGKLIVEIEAEVIKFLAELEETCAKLVDQYRAV